MKDVAAQAGVSAATVSRALSNPERVSPEIVERVRLAVAELDYAPNAAAGSLRRRDTGLVLVLLPDIGNSFFSKLLNGIETRAREAGLSVLIGDTGADNANLGAFRTKLQEQRADGMILLNGQLPNGLDARSRAESLPIVIAAEHIRAARLSSVTIDNRAAAAQAVAHLQALGHRRIAHIAGPPDNILTRARIDGYSQQLARAGHVSPRMAHGDFSFAGGRAAAQMLLSQRGPRPTAIFAANDAMAIGAITALRAEGLSVPEDVSVMGFDDIEIAAFYSPSLTTVAQPRFDIGYRAMSLLQDRLRSPTAPVKRVVLPTTIVERASTRPLTPS